METYLEKGCNNMPQIMVHRIMTESAAEKYPTEKSE
jgi:hypothetical protein